MTQRSWLVVILLGGGLVACGGGGSSTPSGPPTLSIAPSSITVPAGGTQPFTATSSSGSTGTVTWEVNGTAGGNTTDGTISSSGMYTAPPQVPSPQPIIVTALGNGLKATASLTVAYSQASLQGSYMAGFTELAGSQETSLIGYFDFDGQGDVNGTVDVNSTMAGVLTGVAVTGHDTINPDGGGTLSLDAGAAGSFNLDVTLAASGIFAITDATGGKITATLWVPQAVVQGVTSLTPGTYIVSYGGSAPNRQGVGAVTVTAGNQLTVQELDQHNSGNGVSTLETNLPGSYTLSANGRGTFNFTDAQGTHHFVMYAMPGGDFQIMGLDTGTPLTGSLDLQTATALPTSGVAVVTADNFDAGNDPDMLLAQTDLANMTYLGSQNDNGLVTGISGTGTVQSADSYGRGQLTIPTASGPRTFVYYVETSTQIDLLEIDQQGNLGGALVPAAQYVPVGGGNYVLAGGFYTANSQTPSTLVAVLDIASLSQISGTETLNSGGAVSTVSFSGSLSFGNDGGMLMLNLSNGMVQHFMVLGYSSGFFTLLGEDASNISGCALIVQYFVVPAS